MGTADSEQDREMDQPIEKALLLSKISSLVVLPFQWSLKTIPDYFHWLLKNTFKLTNEVNQASALDHFASNLAT